MTRFLQKTGGLNRCTITGVLLKTSDNNIIKKGTRENKRNKQKARQLTSEQHHQARERAKNATDRGIVRADSGSYYRQYRGVSQGEGVLYYPLLFSSSSPLSPKYGIRQIPDSILSHQSIERSSSTIHNERTKIHFPYPFHSRNLFSQNEKITKIEEEREREQHVRERQRQRENERARERERERERKREKERKTQRKLEREKEKDTGQNERERQ